MKKILTLSFTLLCWSVIAQIQHNINKSSGTISNPINQIDSIRFNTATNQMEVELQSGVVTHAITDVINVTFSLPSNACGSDTSVTDIDGNEYPIVQIGNQCWTAENLKTTKFSDGSVIQNVTTGAYLTVSDSFAGNNNLWESLSSPAWTIYLNDATNEATYGKLYNGYTVTDTRNVCPAGWHVPTDAEWTILTDFLGGTLIAGGKMKSTGTQYWQSPNLEATNESGFSGLPGGLRYFNGYFLSNESVGYWWSSTTVIQDFEINPKAYKLTLTYDSGVADILSSSFKKEGHSVRCLKD